MNDHLSDQGRLDQRGGLHCFWCRNKTSTPPIGASGTLKFIRNGLGLRKLQSLKVEWVMNSKKQTTQRYKAGS